MARSTFAISTVLVAVALAGVACSQVLAEPLPIVKLPDAQPFTAQAKRVVQALALLGAPLTADRQAAFDAALAEPDDAKRVAALQAVLDPLALVGVNVNAESRVKVAQGEAAPQLVQQGWRVFLVKVHNEAGVTAELRVESPNAAPLHKR